MFPPDLAQGLAGADDHALSNIPAGSPKKEELMIRVRSMGHLKALQNRFPNLRRYTILTLPGRNTTSRNFGGVRSEFSEATLSSIWST